MGTQYKPFRIVCMKNTFVASLVVILVSPCVAQTSEPVSPPAASAALTRADPAEPDVQRTHVEDQGSRIDELRVRGQTQRVVVTPKAPGSKPYEIIMGNAGRAVPDGTGGANSAVGKRVWNVLSF